MTFSELSRRVKEHIGQRHRYEHSVRVARCADVLAQRHGFDAGKARLAGMLHDLARLYPAQRLMEECEARGMAIEEFERAHPIVLHARLSAALAQEQFGVTDTEVLSAIEKHTTAAAEMSPIDCALYLADSIEPGRSHADRAEHWELAMRDVGEAMRAVLASSLRYFGEKGIPASPQTVAAARAFGLRPEEVGASAN